MGSDGSFISFCLFGDCVVPADDFAFMASSLFDYAGGFGGDDVLFRLD